MGDRRQRQNAEKRKKQAERNLDKAVIEGNRGTEEAKKEEDRANKHLDRMRMGYAEGTKLFFDIYKTLATLTTASILVIVALSRDLLPANASYSPLLWLAYFGLLVSMLAALISMELLTSGVFVTLTKEADDIQYFSELTHDRLKRRTRISGWSFGLGIYLFVVFVALPPLVGIMGWWAYVPFLALPLLVRFLLKKWL